MNNISLDKTLNIWIDRAFQNESKVKELLKQHFRQLLILTVKFCLFYLMIFNTNEQINSVVMRSPSGPTFSNLFLVYYEHKWLENCPLGFVVALLMKHSKCLIKKYHNRKLLKYLNTPNIEFSFKLEHDNEVLIFR